MFPGSRAAVFYEHVFRTLDQDSSGTIDFKEFLQVSTDVNLCLCPANSSPRQVQVYKFVPEGWSLSLFWYLSVPSFLTSLQVNIS